MLKGVRRGHKLPDHHGVDDWEPESWNESKYPEHTGGLSERDQSGQLGLPGPGL